MKPITILTAAILGMAAHGAQAETPSATAAWLAAVNSGDSAAVASHYTDNAVLISPGAEIVSAPAAISEFWAAKRRAGASDFHVVSVNERLQGDTMYQSAVWATTFTSSNGNVSELEGQMTNMLQHQPDGSWKIQLQSWN